MFVEVNFSVNIVTLILVPLLPPFSGNFLTQKPEFVGIIPNQSVAIGRDAIFTCNVRNLGPYKVIDTEM